MQRGSSRVLVSAGLLFVVSLFVAGLSFHSEAAASGVIGIEALKSAGPDGIDLRSEQIRVQVGDESCWKDPDFSDTSWDISEDFHHPLAGPSSTPLQAPVWFRFKVQLAQDAVGVPLLLKALPYQDDVQVFLNGVRVAGPQDIDPSTRATPLCVVPAQTDNLVALRWIPNKRAQNLSAAGRIPTAFSLFLCDYKAVLERFDREKDMEFFYGGHRTALIGLYAIFFLFHLTLYASYRSRLENVYYCLTAFSCTLALVALHVSEIYHYDRTIWRIAYLYFYLALMPLSTILGMGMLQVLFVGHTRWTLRLYVAVAVAFYAASPYLGNASAYLLPVLMVPELLYLVWQKRASGQLLFGPSALAMFAMLIVVCAAFACLRQWDSGSGLARYAAWYSFVVFLQISTMALVREYARDKRRIEAFASTLEDEVATRTHDLKAALADIKTLHGIIPICMHCHKIRDDHESWQGLEKYIQNHSEAQFSHGLCPECLAEHYPDIAEDMRNNPKAPLV